MPSEKGFSVILLVPLILIILALIGGAFYFGRSMSTNNDLVGHLKEVPPLVNVKDNQPVEPDYHARYINTEKGFSFELPVNVYQQNKSNYSDNRDVLFVGDQGTEATLTIQDLSLNIVREDYPNAKDITLGDRPGLRQENTVLIPFGIMNSSVVVVKAEKSEFIDHLAKTIIFNELSKIDDTQSWQVYEDQENGFSFSYPALFQTEKFNDEIGNKGVRLMYNNEIAGGFPPVVPPKIVFEAKAIKTQQPADEYANDLNVTLQANLDKSKFTFLGVVADRISSQPANKISVFSKDIPGIPVVFYVIVDLKDGVLEMKGYYLNTQDLTPGKTVNVLDTTIYRTKIDKSILYSK